MPDNHLTAIATPNAVAGLAQCSPNLAKALETPTEGYQGPDGFSLRPTTWKCPSNPSAELRREANERAASLSVNLRTPATANHCARWLASLGNLVAGQMSAQDVRDKLTAYAGNLDYPAGLYTQDSLKAAGKRFKWFPSFAELTEFLDARKADMEAELSRCRAIARGGNDGGSAPAAPANHRTERTPEDWEWAHKLVADATQRITAAAQGR